MSKRKTNKGDLFRKNEVLFEIVSVRENDVFAVTVEEPKQVARFGLKSAAALVAHYEKEEKEND